LPASLAVLLCGLAAGPALCAEDVIVIGTALSLTGKYALHGKHSKNGYEFAVRKINDKGGVKVGGKSYRLTLRYYDDESIPARGAAHAEHLIRQDGIKFILGPNSPSLTKALLPLVEKYKVPMIEGSGGTRDLFAQGGRYVFAVASSADQYLVPAIDLAAEHAEELGKTKAALKVALATEDDPFAQDVRAGVLEAAMRHGMNIVIDDQLPAQLNDMSATLTKVNVLRPDVLVVSGQEKGALTAIAQVKALKVDVPILAMTHCDSAQITEKLGEAAEHVFCAHQWHRSLGYKDEVFGMAEDFAKQFEQAYAYEAPYQAAQSAVAVYVFVDALKRARSSDPEIVRDAIAATELETFYGPIKFDASGRNVAKPMFLTQAQDGKYVLVAPAKWATAKPVVPRPFQ
jgi:branched-chain amino acid transport system substrate-binding protein